MLMSIDEDQDTSTWSKLQTIQQIIRHERKNHSEDCEADKPGISDPYNSGYSNRI